MQETLAQAIKDAAAELMAKHGLHDYEIRIGIGDYDSEGQTRMHLIDPEEMAAAIINQLGKLIPIPEREGFVTSELPRFTMADDCRVIHRLKEPLIIASIVTHHDIYPSATICGPGGLLGLHISAEAMEDFKLNLSWPDGGEIELFAVGQGVRLAAKAKRE